jgi:uncharacterized repeat protein (TIGR02543 family)
MYRPRKSIASGVSLIVLLALIQNITIATQSKAVVVNDVSSVCPIEIVPGTANSVLVTTSGIYCVVQFRTVDTYTVSIPAGVSAVDYLVVGGGGGGASGGGGGGGVLTGNNYSVSPNETITVIVGAGGAGGTGGSGFAGTPGVNGRSSSFASITALGGGGGDTGGDGANAGSGSSGGGARYDCTSGCAGSGTFGQGNAGGLSTYNSYGAGGGGGGAGGTGFNTTRNYIGGNGGNGIASSITGTQTYYGGGGGGGINSNDNQYVGLNNSVPPGLIYGGSSGAAAAGTVYTNGGGQGGLGGGGRGSSFGRSGGVQGQYANATAGADNFGGGGGGTDPEDINAGGGGSGTVIFRYVASTNLKTITFNQNSESVVTTTQRVASGVSTALTANSFIYAGKIFSSWNTAANGSGTSYSNSANITITNDLTLYAQWIDGVTKTVSFNSNSGSGTMSNQVAGTATALNTNTFTRTGYTFARWSTAADGTGYTYADGANYAFTADQTLYAQWTAVVTSYTVSFFGNSATGGTTPSQSASTSTALTLNGFTRTGYSFLGWNTNYNAGTASYLDGQNYAFTSSTSLYAIWVLQAVNQVTFNGNSSTSGTTDSQTASVNTVLNSNAFLRTGYTFLRWNTAANGTGVNYSPGYSYSFATSVTLYAIWGQNLTISYDSNTSTSGTVPTSQAYYVGGPNLTVSENTGSLTKTGYTLAGWNTAANGSGTSYALGALNATFASNATLYAQWTAATYTLLYVGNANTSGAAPSSQSYVSGGTALTIAGNSGTLVKRWHNFIGWNSAANGNGTNYTIGDSTVVISADTILYAKWLRTSLYGVEEADLTELQSWNASTSSVTTTVSNPSNTSSASITFPGSSLPSGTTIKLWELANSNVARAKIDASKDYLVNIVLSWAKADGTIPDAVSAITIVIRNSSIKKGAIGYQIIGDTVAQIGTSSADGELTLSITQDPIIAIANAPVQNNNNGGGGGAPVVTVPEPTVSKPVVDVPQNRITSFTKTTKVYFGLNASWMNSQNIKNIRAFLAGVSKTGNIKEITIQGFTQPTRINPDPLGLSVARAKAVGKVVKSQGLASRVITQGKGNANGNNSKSRYVLVTVTGELIGN